VEALMLRNNRLVYHPRYIEACRATLDVARADLAALARQHQCEIADLRRELNEVRALYDELCAAVRARQLAESELARLYREREIARAERTTRDPAAPLN
jgi:hypothetical protein